MLAYNHALSLNTVFVAVIVAVLLMLLLRILKYVHYCFSMQGR